MTPHYCYFCKHYNKDKINTCFAFPKGIPIDILLLKKPHDKVLNNQTGKFVFDEKK